MNDSVAGIYKDGRYAASNPSCGEENTAWKAGQVLRMMEKHGLKPGSVCEVGCGSGGVIGQLHAALPEHVRFTGIEPMPEAFAVCSAKRRERLEFRHCTAADVAETFDLVLLLDVFEHVEDFMGFLRSLRRLGRQFIFHIPLDMTAQMVLRDKPIMRVRDQVGHLHYFSKNTALAALRDTGYEVQDWFYSDMRGAAYSSPGTKLLRLPRRVLMRIAPDFAVRLLGGNPLTVLARPAAGTDLPS
jgi:2-polyprenyl-3-methyl-5-hydroxy-6-metoxy-1,4-benzoquinol methylase